MRFLKFKSAKDMYDMLIDGPELYSPTKELLIFHYNIEGAIAHYDIDREKAQELVKESIENSEYWSGLLGPGGYIIDTLDNGKDITPVIDYLEDLYEEVWVTADDYKEMLDCRYYFTNFCCWEQDLIDQLRKEGYFVYGVRDKSGNHFSIEKRVIVNNIGFLVSTKEFDTPISDIELSVLGTEDVHISDKIREVSESISPKLALAKAKYELKEAERNKIIDELNSRLIV